MKRIAIVAHGLSDGGAERVAALLANKLFERGNRVLFIAAYSNERVYKLSDGVDYIYIEKGKSKFTRFLSRTIAIDRAIERFKSDIVISFIFKEILKTSIKGKVPIVYSLRIDPANATAKLGNRILCNYTYSRAKAIVFQTPDARDFFKDEIRNKGVVIGNPLTPNLPFWDEEKHEKRIITACRLTEQKNLPMLIKGFAAFSKQFPDYSLWIYGKGPLKEKLLEIAKDYQIEDKVHLPGYANNIHEIMAHSAVFALTSDFEGLSNSMLEALAIGVPTVCTDCPPGGASLYIKDHVNGMLIPVGDEAALAKALCELADSKQLQRSMSMESRIIRKTLSEDVVIDAWVKLL